MQVKMERLMETNPKRIAHLYNTKLEEYSMLLMDMEAYRATNDAVELFKKGAPSDTCCKYLKIHLKRLMLEYEYTKDCCIEDDIFLLRQLIHFMTDVPFYIEGYD